MTSLPQDVRSITALCIGRVGDVIVATPFLRALRARFKRARIRLLVSYRSVGVLPLIASIDDWAVLQKPQTILGHFKLARQVFAEPCDLLVDLNSSYSTTSSYLARAISAPVKLAFQKGRGDVIFNQHVHAPDEREHMNARYARLAAALDAPYEPRLELYVPPEDEARADRLLKSLPGGLATGTRVLIHPGNFDRFGFRWPEDKFVALTNRLLKDPALTLYYMGGPGEEPYLRWIVERLDRPVEILPTAPLGVVAAMIRKMDLFVCNITGTTHLAAAVGARTFGIYAGYTETVWRPWGAGHFGVTSRLWQSCRELTVDEVERALKESLKAVSSLH